MTIIQSIRKLLLLEGHTCPWWLAYSWDHRLRKLIHDPDKMIKPYVKPGNSVMDVGCGMGYFSIAMADFVGDCGKVTAVDIQQKMLDVLMRRSQRHGLDKRITPVLTRDGVPGEPGSMDFILTFWMLHEVAAKEAFARDLYSLLKANGSYLLVEPKIHTSKDVFEDEIAICRKAGFILRDNPGVGISRAACFTK